MEISFNSLDIPGYQNRPVPNTLITHPNPSGHLGIILPGFRYSPDMAPLHYAARILLEQGADILQVEYAYYRTDFMQQPENEQDVRLSSDVFAACDAGLSYRPYQKITLVGKSLGTLAMGHLFADSRFQKAACIWLTPLLTVDWLCSRIEQVRPRSLFVIGTDDQFYKPDILERLELATGGSSLVIEGANHALEIPGDIPQSLFALDQMVQAFQEFHD
jgi:hypothetical protein